MKTHQPPLLCLLLIAATALGTATTHAQSAALSIRHAPVPGGIAIVELPAGAHSARFQGQAVLIFGQSPRRALVGLPLDIAPGPQTLTLDQGSLSFQVEAKDYPTQHVTIKDQGKVELSAENLARVKREHAEISAFKRRHSALDTPDLAFAAPANGPKSGRFGARRVFNGLPRAPHSGLDFAVPQGTPILSAAAGTVIGVADYFFNGKTVFVDHGQGLITLYCHLDRIDVAAGQAVTRGQNLGAAGSTGRASGPHLHWSVILNGTVVDPELFLP